MADDLSRWRLLGLAIAACLGAFPARARAEAPPVPAVKVLGATTIVVDPTANTGQAVIEIRNAGAAPIAHRLLQAGNFRSTVTGREINAQALFAAPDENAGKLTFLLDNVAPGSSVPIKVMVSGVWEAGPLRVPLLLEGETIAELWARKERVPFNVKLESVATAAAPLRLQQGVDHVLLVRNEDAMNYRFVWQLAFGNTVVRGSDQADGNKIGILAASNVTQVRARLPDSLFPNFFTGLFRDRHQDGWMEVRIADTDGGDPATQPAKTFPVSVRLAYWPDWVTSLASGIFVFLLLAAGGITSLLLNHSVPTAVRRLVLRQQLGRLAARIKRLPEHIDLHIRVELRVLRLELSRRVATERVILPGASDVIDQASREAVVLEHKIDLIEQIGKRLQHIAAMSVDGPPNLLAREETKLVARLRVLAQAQIGDAEIQALRPQIAEVDSIIARIENGDPGLLAEVLDKARTFWKMTFQPLWESVRAASTTGPTTLGLPAKNWALGLRQQMEPYVTRAGHCFGADKPSDDVSKGIEEKLEWVDTAFAKLELITEYIRFCESATPEQHKLFELSGYVARPAPPAPPASPSGTPFIPAPPTAAAVPRAADTADVSESLSLETTHRDRFLRCLSGTGRNSLHEARLVLRQAEEGIFVRHIADQIAKGRFAIKIEPQTVQQQELVVFSLLFNEEKFNGAAARGKMDCIWTFRHGKTQMQEKGWTVCHFFPDAGPTQITVELRRGDVKFVVRERNGQDGDPAMRALTIRSRVGDNHAERAKLEIIQLSVALGATLGALMGGAREQIQRLDMSTGVAIVFALGFGADVLKNLVARRTTPSAPT